MIVTHKALLACLAAAAVPALAAQHSCGAALDPATKWVAEGDSYAIALAPMAPRIVVGRHFNLDLVVCPRGDAPAPASIRIDADMPAHQHGMNYRASVKPLGALRYRAEGLMFHMPGRWRFIVDITTARGTTRITHELDLQ